MLIAISDLHFVDQTAGANPFAGSAFELFFEDMDWYLSRRPQVQSVELLLVGDIFDLLRTNGWHQDKQGQALPLEDRPWGQRGLQLQKQAAQDPMQPTAGPMFSRAEAILADIIAAAQNQLQAFIQGVARIRQRVPNTSVIYMQGNHDRLLNLHPKLRRMARQALGMPLSDDLFPEAMAFDEYGVYATHGHQYDPYNFGGALPDGRQDLALVPIGDAITSELFSRIPLVAREQAQAMPSPLPPAEIQAMCQGLQQMDNVRPMIAVPQWLHSQAQGLPQFQAPIAEAVQKVFRYFNDIPFVKAWSAQGGHPLAIKVFFECLEHFNFSIISRLLETLSGLLKDYAAKDPRPQAAAEIAAQYPADAKYVLMGHTHEPKQSALAVSGPILGLQKPQVYLNTGTWRPRQHQCLEHGDFIQWKDLTYVVVYKKNERDGGNPLPVFDTWTGKLYS